MDEETIKSARELVKKGLDTLIGDEIIGMRLGPRSTEITFETRAGKRVTASVRVQDLL